MTDISFPPAPTLNQTYTVGAVTFRFNGTVWEREADPPSTVYNVVTLIEAPSITLNAALGTTFRLTLTGNRTLLEPTNPADGQTIQIEVTQDGVGGHTLSLASGAAGFLYGTSITNTNLTATPLATDVITAKYSASRNRWLVIGFVKGFVP